jgi:hypothetical protein
MRHSRIRPNKFMIWQTTKANPNRFLQSVKRFPSEGSISLKYFLVIRPQVRRNWDASGNWSRRCHASAEDKSLRRSRSPDQKLVKQTTVHLSLFSLLRQRPQLRFVVRIPFAQCN